jgi:very-short-patch-repair endonuclease
MSAATEATISEARLWRALRARYPGWIREYATGPYRLDFYCPAAKVAIEIDGSSHANYEAARRDMQRDAWHRERGITTIRVSVRDVMRSRRSILRIIDQAVAQKVPKAGWRARRRHSKAVREGTVYVGPSIERIVTIADRPLEIADPRQAAAMRRYSQPRRRDGGTPF